MPERKSFSNDSVRTEVGEMELKHNCSQLTIGGKLELKKVAALRELLPFFRIRLFELSN